MLGREELSEAREFLMQEWGISGAKVIAECDALKNPFSGNTGEFLAYCKTCGGNWNAMFLSGIRKLWPGVYDAIPDSMGKNGNRAFFCIMYVLMLCGVDTSQ